MIVEKEYQLNGIAILKNTLNFYNFKFCCEVFRSTSTGSPSLPVLTIEGNTIVATNRVVIRIMDLGTSPDIPESVYIIKSSSKSKIVLSPEYVEKFPEYKAIPIPDTQICDANFDCFSSGYANLIIAMHEVEPGYLVDYSYIQDIVGQYHVFYNGGTTPVYFKGIGDNDGKTIMVMSRQNRAYR